MEEKEKSDKSYKILLLGDSAVGKTCFLKCYIDETFQDVYLSTIGFDFKYKCLTLKDGKNIKMQIWDTAGQERFRTIARGYYKGAHGIILIYDVTNAKSFDNIKKWLSQIKEEAPSKVCVILVANKIDIEKREVTKEEGEALANDYNLDIFESSARDNINVSEVFQELAENIYEKNKLLQERGTKLTEVIEEIPQKKKKRCC